jgi:hypothetical protein
LLFTAGVVKHQLILINVLFSVSSHQLCGNLMWIVFFVAPI